MPYFKIKTGYNPTDFISIDNLGDLEKAQLAFLTNAKVMFSNGSVCRGQDIISIREDWHREMGWNPDHVIEADDLNYMQLQGVEGKYVGLLGKAKDNVQTLMAANRQDLIGKSEPIEDRLKLLK